VEKIEDKKDESVYKKSTGSVLLSNNNDLNYELRNGKTPVSISKLCSLIRYRLNHKK
jgi:hypothetical protein